MDAIDAKLLGLLQQDCSQSLADLGACVGLSISAVNERLRKLRARGDIRAYVALVEPRNLGYRAAAFVGVVVEGARHRRDFVRRMEALPQVLECHHVSGEFPYLLKIRVPELDDIERFIEATIERCPGVLRTHTSVVLSSPKERVTGLPVKT